MAKVAIILADLFEDSEYLEPAVSLKKAGHEIIHIGLRAGVTVKGKKKATAVRIDISVEEANPADFDALLIPGGHSPDKLRGDARAVSFVREFMTTGKPVFCICHGPQLLISANVIGGRNITGYKSIVHEIKQAGGIFHDREVVIDSNLVSSRKPADLPAFIAAFLELLKNCREN